MRHNQESIPRLRFPEFHNKWRPHELKEFLRERNEWPSEALPLYSLTIKEGIVPKSERYERSFLVKHEEDAYKVMYKDDFAFNPMNLRFGALARYKGEEKIVVSKYYNIFYCNENADPTFCENFLTTDNMIQFYNKMSAGSLEEKRRVHYLDFIKFRVPFPELPEQRRIAAFLSAVDKKIGQLSREQELLLQYKKGVMEQLFDQKIRFKDDDGNDFPYWEDQTLSALLLERKTRNSNNQVEEVFSVAKNSGVINQLEHLRRSYAADDTSNYKVVLPGDIVYTKSPTSEFPYGIIKQNKTGRSGIVSVLYAVFIPKTPQLGLLLDYYFSSWVKTYNYLNPVVHKGAKNTINIGNNDFLRGKKISLPISPNEIGKIVHFLSALDQRIGLSETQVETTKRFKSGLLQQMFV